MLWFQNRQIDRRCNSARLWALLLVCALFVALMPHAAGAKSSAPIIARPLAWPDPEPDPNDPPAPCLPRTTTGLTIDQILVDSSPVRSGLQIRVVRSTNGVASVYFNLNPNRHRFNPAVWCAGNDGVVMLDASNNISQVAIIDASETSRGVALTPQSVFAPITYRFKLKYQEDFVSNQIANAKRVKCTLVILPPRFFPSKPEVLDITINQSECTRA